MHEQYRDPEFVKRLINKESDAITEVVKAYTSHLVKAGLGMGFSEEKANDIAHSTWLTFYEIVPRFEGRSHIRTFLFGIFYKKVSEFRRSNMKFEKSDPIEDVIESKFLPDGHWNHQIVDPSDYLEGSEVVGIVEKCVDALPDMQKAAFVLKVVQEFETSEILEILGVSNTNLRQLLFRGRNRVKECVEAKLKA